MSKKRLDRTVIEGGRDGSNKTDRYASHAEDRAHEKNYITDVMHDPENWYDYDIDPTRPVRKEFSDKLGPMYRWLHSQVGRLWDDVRSEVVKVFDTRTTAGRHIVYDHLISSVEVTPDYRYGRYSRGPEDRTTSYYRNDFYVDDSGILCIKTLIPRNADKKVPAYDTNQLANWLSGRVVGKMGNKYFWFVPVGKGKKHGGSNHTWKTVWGRFGGMWSYNFGLHFQYLSYDVIYKKDSLGRNILNEAGAPIELERKPKWVSSSPNALRQDRKLNDKEMKYWNTIPEHYRNKVLELSPNYPLPIQQRKYY